MQAVFHFPQDAAIRREFFLKTNQTLNKKDKHYKLEIANALWIQKDSKFLDDYLGLVKKYYDGKVTNLDLVREPEKSRLTINNWVEQKTNKKIKDLIPRGALNSSPQSLLQMVLTNAVYFKSFWFKPFKKSHTKDKDFRINASNKIMIPMMYLDGEYFNYAETDVLQILELPYKGEKISMLIFLPKEDNLKALEDVLSAKNSSEWRSLLKREKTIITLPKFKFETKYFMAGDLKGMGMLAAFTPGIDFGGQADFSGMTGDQRLNINEVIHQAFVDVDEEGTEAAAATAIVMSTMAAAPTMQPEPIKIFTADHPFIFVIQDRDTGIILFVGRVSDPRK